MENILVIAPHPDDETLGCGASIKKWLSLGHQVHWLITTSMKSDSTFSSQQINTRNEEIEQVANAYGFASVTKLDLSPASLSDLDIPKLIENIGNKVSTELITTLVLPFKYDAHSDHKVVFDAAISCTKSFRYPSIQKVLVYETLSETHYGLDTAPVAFTPNYYVNISAFLDDKKEIFQLFKSEIGTHPFPRSLKSIDALATIRGAECGCEAAEAFMLLKSIN